MATIIKPPTSVPYLSERTKELGTSIFLAGSIEQGTAVDWQSQVEEALVDTEAVIFNPRRDHWDSSWEQSIDNPQFVEQVEWELEALDRADTISMYFDPNTKSPVTLLEFGLLAIEGNLVVCCPEPFWRKGNVDVVCNRYGVKQVATLEELIDISVERMSNVGWL